MTPEQIARLTLLASDVDAECAVKGADAHFYLNRTDADTIRALLAEWEERGREVERLRASTLPDVVPEDVDALRDEVARLRHEVERRKAEVEELKRENTLLHGDLQAAEAKLERMIAAEARLAKVVKAADALLSYLQQLELLTYEPADWENPTVVEFKAALAAAKGEK